MPFIEIIKKDLWQDAVRVEAEQVQEPQKHKHLISPDKTAADANKKSLVRALVKVCDNTHSSELLEQTWKSWPSAA